MQAPISVVATISHTTPRCCRDFFDFLFPKMVEPSRPSRPKLPKWQLSQKYLANRRSLVRSYAKQSHCGHLIAEPAVKRSLNRDILRARPATFEELRDTLIAKFTTHDTWEDFIRVRRNNHGNGQGVYSTGVTKLMQLLTADMGIATTPVGAYLGLLPALDKALESRWGGKSMELVFSPDYAPTTEPQGHLHQQQIAFVWSAMVQKNSGTTLIGYGSLRGIFTTNLHAALPLFAS